MRKLIASFSNSLKEYALAYAAIFTQALLWIFVVYEQNLNLSDEVLRWLFTGIAATQFIFVFSLPLFSWWKSKPEMAQSRKWLSALGLIVLAVADALMVYAYSWQRSPIGLEWTTLAVMLLAYYGLSLVVLYRGAAARLWNYTYHLVTNHGISYAFGLIFFLGMMLIFWSLDALFKINIPDEVMQLTAIFSMVLLANTLILSRLVLFHDAEDTFELPRIWQVFSKYIAIPLVTVFTGILLLYFVTLIVTGVLPSNQLTMLIISLFVPGLFTIYLIWPQLEQSAWRRWFVRGWLSAALIIAVMYFYAIYLRINQYGFTVERLIIVMLGMVAVAVFLTLITGFKHRLAISVLLGATLPLLGFCIPFINIFYVSEVDQVQRFITELESTGRLQNGVISENVKIKEEKHFYSLESKLTYLWENHGLDLLDAELTADLQNMLQLSGTGFLPAYDEDTFNRQRNVTEYLLGDYLNTGRPGELSVYLNLELNGTQLNISDYSSMVAVSIENYDSEQEVYTKEIEDLKLGTTAGECNLTITHYASTVNFDLTTVVGGVEIVNKQDSQKPIDEMYVTSTDSSGQKFGLAINTLDARILTGEETGCTIRNLTASLLLPQLATN